MSDVFLSWAHEDEATATAVKDGLEAKARLDVWLDRNIEYGAKWADEIERRLDVTPCVVVLWSRASARSLWVKAEAGQAAERETLLPVRIDTVDIPVLFRGFQTHDLIGWNGNPDHAMFQELCDSVRRKVGERMPDQSWFTSVPRSRRVDARHLTLVHTVWRAPQHGDEMYRVNLIVHGHPSALARIARVRYILEGWENGEEKPCENRSTNFELRELAYGDFMAEALVEFKDGQKALRLRRFVNLTQEGPRLDRFMIAQRRNRGGR